MHGWIVLLVLLMDLVHGRTGDMVDLSDEAILRALVSWSETRTPQID